jgi:hypothetical protein
MNSYIVSATHKSHEKDRQKVILDVRSHGIDLQHITARDFFAARLLVDESPFYHDPGHGWFLMEAH